MKRTNKKGFTIVELVIVIAVIAILAAVMIPTFSGIIAKANESAALQEVTNAYKAALVEALADGDASNETEGVTVGAYKFTFSNTDGTEGIISPSDEDADLEYEFKLENGFVEFAE